MIAPADCRLSTPCSSIAETWVGTVSGGALRAENPPNTELNDLLSSARYLGRLFAGF